MSYECAFKVGDRVRTTAYAYPKKIDRIGTVSFCQPVYDEEEDEDGNLVNEDIAYYDLRVTWDNEELVGYYDESELEHVDEASSFIPEDWS